MSRLARLGAALAGAAMFAGSFWLFGVAWWYLNTPAANSPLSYGAHGLALAALPACVFGAMGAVALAVTGGALASDA